LARRDTLPASPRNIIAEDPTHAGATHFLGVIAQQQGRNNVAIELIRKSIELNPNVAEAYSNLGLALEAKGARDEAIASYQQSIKLQPDNVGAHNNLGNALRDKGQLDDAIAAFRRAVALKPDFATAHNNLGNALRDKRQLDEAMAAYRQAIALRPDYAEAHSNVGTILRDQGRLEEAIAAYRKAVSLDPKLAAGFKNLGKVLGDTGKTDEALVALRKSILLDPKDALAHLNLGNVLKDTGQLDEAIGEYRRAIEIAPDVPLYHSNLVCTLHFHPGYDARAIYEEASRFNQKHAQPLAHLIRPHKNDRDPDRPLRIGYVSCNFRNHPSSHNFLPLAIAHDREQFHFTCYSGGPRDDAVTDRLRRLASEWRKTALLSDEHLAELVRQDKIDILVDLTAHMANNRLLVFARKPAPVQVTMLCSMGTTGLPTIDYRISDRYSDPTDFNDAWYAEETVRLPDCYFCHEVPSESPPVNALPAETANHITFGSLNNFCKVTPAVLRVWGQILAAIHNSRMLLRCPAGSTQARVRNAMAEHGVAPDRMEFIDRLLPAQEYLRLHHHIDLYLDPFPYSGHTTSMDPLWMGVPLVTLAGRTDVNRSGVFLLSNLQMEELIAQSEAEYIDKTIELASKLPRLAEYRGTLRERMRRSPLLDPQRFTRNVEAAYRGMWRKWCRSAHIARGDGDPNS
jgi:protein O-GlcNAc transferase